MPNARLLLGLAAGLATASLHSQPLSPQALSAAANRVTLVGNHPAPPTVALNREWSGPLCRLTLENRSTAPVRIAEVVLFDLAHGFPADTPVYGEGFTKLSQAAGSLARPSDLDPLTDRGHYKLPVVEGLHTVYGLLRIGPAAGATRLLAFTSCRRFVGQFRFNGERLQIAHNTEGLTLGPGETWDLEELLVTAGPDPAALLAELAARIVHHHPRLPYPKLPTGWCSWYCFGPKVTRQNIVDNLAVARAQLPELRFIQIDDGYQPWMGDWLETGKAFGGSVQGVLRDIRTAGFEPAIWVAPFVASPESQLFAEHPDWFVRDEAGRPLRSDTVTFGGWRLGPWYLLDGTHPEAQQHLERVFRTMREDWGCTYFKLDANAWGAFPFGRLHDPKASHVEAFRRGMAAIRRGTGDGFLLGCNHALWPSLGEVHGSRSSMDIVRQWDFFTRTGRENLLRNWQNDRLWWNDPDCIVLTGTLPAAAELDFHRSVVYATGGMLLSGDDLTRLTPAHFASLHRLAANPGIAARFESDALDVGTIPQGESTLAVFLNWSETPAPRTVRFAGPRHVTDFWTGEDLGRHVDRFVLDPLPPRSGRIFRLRPTD